MAVEVAAAAPQAPTVLSRGLITLLSVAVGVVVANLYYTQPLVAIIGHAIGLAPSAVGLVMMLTQIGYCIGILVAVPLGDLLENKRLILTMIGIAVLGLIGLAFAQQTIPYFIAAFATGLGASTVQIIMPYAASFVPEAHRGATVGKLMSGLMLGIMLSRPTSSLLADLISWHAPFVMSAALMVLLALILGRALPPRKPAEMGLRFSTLFRSMGSIFLSNPVLRRRALYQSLLFASFCLFWTAAPLLLASPRFGFSQSEIALFAFVGVAGAIASPIAGRLADKGFSKHASLAGFASAIAAFLLGHAAPGLPMAIAWLGLMAILLDAGVSANFVLGQRAIFTLDPKLRGRLNALLIATTFAGGAAGSAIGAWTFERGGWGLATWVGLAFPAVTLAVFVTER